ncbi:hypothetical protein KFK09_029015 [Dendrobium nobile]|uniref:Uncharacterized protein n=1 Tax=Dendrobium nobile TaxID=94219 RepID=A0A8T3A9E8_DENNO|nr:hypothetical protein KFK09_029015 [Dendrobium nobile]
MFKFHPNSILKKKDRRNRGRRKRKQRWRRRNEGRRKGDGAYLSSVGGKQARLRTWKRSRVVGLDLGVREQRKTEGVGGCCRVRRGELRWLPSGSETRGGVGPGPGVRSRKRKQEGGSAWAAVDRTGFGLDS